MCEQCGESMGTQQQIEFVRRYLTLQEDRLREDPGNEDARLELARTRELLGRLEQVVHPAGRLS